MKLHGRSLSIFFLYLDFESRILSAKICQREEEVCFDWLAWKTLAIRPFSLNFAKRSQNALFWSQHTKLFHNKKMHAAYVDLQFIYIFKIKSNRVKGHISKSHNNHNGNECVLCHFMIFFLIRSSCCPC